MKIWIDDTALNSNSDSLLPSGTLFAMRYLQENDAELSFDSDSLSDQQIELIKNEEIHAGDFDSEQADGWIQKKQSFQFITNETIIEEADDWTKISHKILFPSRKALIERNTKETDICVSINLDGTGQSSINTGLNFFDHMLEQIARHGLVDLEIRCDGDLEVDEHHSIEDTAIALGQAIREAISDNKAGIQRYGFALPMDEAQANVAIDLSDRPYLQWNVQLSREYVGDFPTEMLEHFFYSLAMNARATLHVSADGKNEHHIIEAIFKGFAKALRFSVSRNERIKGILPTTKGTI
ncbi:imidazoleglycerol-phosphate dehydratase HisB [Rhodohalobacter sulfatireducens]|uniref:Imidazoleglycerol-phosphate dehydratase n=1 Tax=Rhodohalobacter sulfatireducens TaxID=2911366 RepID=A0ABS9K995_9BACT|nr:imidazoleglycerol-phosphate dehydratase HisB [Rhodohalobacter sulfatireducens]MCG2587405.1 imidazoleglycerol-phosphate dehydratase HisB [Rhodohalobacter sulfatireducens]